MQHKIVMFVLLFIILPFHSLAANYQSHQNSGDLGVGAILGSPTAITGKYFFADKRSVDFGLSFFSNDYTLLYGDYIIEFPNFMSNVKDLNQLVGYIGIGAVMAFTNNTRAANTGFLGTSPGTLGIGARVPFGLLYNMNTTPVEFFGEIVPGISIIPSTSIIIELGIGARYFFR